MVDPITDAAIRAAAVFAQKVLEEAASQTGQALSAGARRLVAWIRHRGTQDPKTGAAVAMLSADPTDQDSIETLGRILVAQIASDPELVRQLQELVADAPEAVSVRDQAQVGMIISGSSIGGQGGHGPAGGGGGGPAFGGGAGGAGGAGGPIYLAPGAPETPVAGGGGGGGGVIPIIREDGSVELIGQPGPGGPGGSYLPAPGPDKTQRDEN
jgi:hypothetical protein